MSWCACGKRRAVPPPALRPCRCARLRPLLQVGPRACLQPIKMFAGSFGGPVIYENAAYVSPNTVRLHRMHVLNIHCTCSGHAVAAAG